MYHSTHTLLTVKMGEGIQSAFWVGVNGEMCVRRDTVSAGTHIHSDSLPEPPTVFRLSTEVVTFNLYSMTPTQ